MSKAPTPKKSPRHILVVAAWGPELDGLRPALPALRRTRGLRLTLAEVGVGLVAAAIGTAAAIAASTPDAVLLVGTAGAFPSKASPQPLGQAFWIGGTTIPADLSQGKDAYLPGLVAKDFAMKDPFPLGNPGQALIRPRVVCPLGITRSTRAARALARSTGATLENLEAHAVVAAAHAAGIPCAAVLGVSNAVGPDGHAEWKRHGKRAADAACALAVHALRSLAKA